MIAYDLYGTKNLSLFLAREHIEKIFGVSLYERNSSYQGGDYYMLGSNDSENFILKANLDPLDDEPVELNFPDYPIFYRIIRFTWSSGDTIGKWYSPRTRTTNATSPILKTSRMPSITSSMHFAEWPPISICSWRLAGPPFYCPVPQRPNVLVHRKPPSPVERAGPGPLPFAAHRPAQRERDAA